MKILKRFLYRQGHYQTIANFYKKRRPSYELSSERFSLSDGDFVDLHWHRQNSKKLLILTHGLEGHGLARYMTGMGEPFVGDGFDVLTWSMRSCSKDINLKKKMYHGGAIDDLHEVINYGLSSKHYDQVILIGFSLGGNIILRYLGDTEITRSDRIKACVAISAPCDLRSSTERLDRGISRIYGHHLFKEMVLKLERKKMLTGIDYSDYLHRVSNITDFNHHIIAKIHGFKDKDDYYDRSSSVHVLKNINVPTLIFNALDDPFLEGNCYPFEQVKKHPWVTLETPRFGGHVGFYDYSMDQYTSELRAKSFIDSLNL